MNLIKHSYGGRTHARYYIDGKRVTRERYERTIIEAGIAGWQHCAFWGRVLCSKPGREHYLYGSSINP